jgi:hypothetical protein
MKITLPGSQPGEPKAANAPPTQAPHVLLTPLSVDSRPFHALHGGPGAGVLMVRPPLEIEDDVSGPTPES